jgi:signal peptide peptidase SppA
MHNARCISAHMGLWCIDDRWFRQALDAIRLGLGPKMEPEYWDSAAMYDMDSRGELYDGGLGLIPLVGPVTKVGSWKHEEASSITTMRAINKAARDPDVKTIMLFVDSPGGTFAGTNELAQTFRDASERYGKQTVAHIEDLGASAAYYVAAQAQQININPTGRTGSIGVVGSIIDSSKFYKVQGLDMHLYSSGPYKGMGYPGTEITPEMDAKFMEEVQEANAFFLDAVTVGRAGRMSRENVEAAATGETFGAQEALKRGLVDQVSFFDDFFQEVQTYGDEMGQTNATTPASSGRRLHGNSRAAAGIRSRTGTARGPRGRRRVGRGTG